MSLSKDQIRELKKAFNEMAKNNPHPDARREIYGYMLSPKELAKEVTEETPVGNQFIELIDYYVTRGHMTFDSVISDLKRPPAP